MAVLQSTNVQGTLCVNGVAIGGGKDFKYCCFTGSTTWTPSQALVDGDAVVDVLAVGGGGGGGGAFSFVCLCIPTNDYFKRATSGGGGGGGVVSDIVDITATDACTVTIGAGGDYGFIEKANPYDGTETTAVTASTAGGDTYFAHVTASGGGGGASNYASCVVCQGITACSRNCTYGGTGNGGGSDTQGGTYGGIAQGGGADFNTLWSGSGASGNSNCNGTLVGGIWLGAGGGAPTNGAFNCAIIATGQMNCWKYGVGPFGTSIDNRCSGFWGTACTYHQCHADFQSCFGQWPYTCCTFDGGEKSYGAGGTMVSADTCIKNCAPVYTFCSCAYMRGGSGKGGLVVLKWFE